MFRHIRRKGLFWYSQRKRFLDWSTVWESSVLGYGNPYLSGRVKNLYKHHPEVSYSLAGSGVIKSQLSRWIREYPGLNGYDFYLVTDVELLSLLSRFRVVSLSWESHFDDFLFHLKEVSPAPSAELGKIITDGDLVFQGKENILPANKNEKTWLYLNNSFPVLPDSANQNIDTIGDFSGIIVGGRHPLGLGGQKLLLIRPDHSREIGFNPITRADFWHLGIYRDCIKHYYDFIKRKGVEERKTTFNSCLSRLEEWADLEKRKLTVMKPSIPFIAKISLERAGKPLSATGEFLKNRFFYRNITGIAVEGESHTDFFIQLPINFPPQHLVNKWKPLTELFQEL